MVGESNIYGEAVLTYQTSLLGCVRPEALVGWAPVDLGLVGRRLVSITGRAGFRCAL